MGVDCLVNVRTVHLRKHRGGGEAILLVFLPGILIKEEDEERINLEVSQFELYGN